MFPFFDHHDYIKDIDNCDYHSFEEKFISLENFSAVAHACVEFPLFTVCPPAFEPRESWEDLTSSYSISAEIRDEMFDAGFHPLSRDLYLKKTYSSEPFADIAPNLGSHLIVDCNYGLFFYEFNGRFLRYGLDQAMFERYRKQLPKHIPFKGQDVLDVGAMRGQFATQNVKKSTSEIVEYSVKSKAELLSIIERVNATPKSSSLKLWFRGQPSDYMMKDFSSPKYSTALPYRNVTDSSLIPSLFRLNSINQKDYKQYYKDLVETQVYVDRVTSYLGIKDYVLRKNGEDENVNFFKSTAWGLYDSGMTSTAVDQDGNEVYKKETYPGFFALQKSFFLQHYGLPSPVLDITHSLDVALFFAQNQIVQGKYEKVDGSQRPVIYLMLLDENVDLFMPSQEICKEHSLLRPQRQECGFIAGASMLNRNYYSRFISVKIYLDDFVEYANHITPDYLFPSKDEDSFLAELLKVKKDEKLKSIVPFELKN
ncbi:hypothetical protein VCSRO93_3544 [Vibrio cholerae]|nr:hypothetical protein VCSRO93_3544 [Vibrio cholerae]